jgi:hypothetical protein
VQRSVLTTAATGATTRSLAGDEGRDGGQVRLLCATQMRIATASAADLRALEAAEQGVYATLGRDTATARSIAQIRKLKKRTAAEPPLQVPTGCAG